MPSAAPVADGARHLRACYSLSECPAIDYDRYGPSFAFSYFLENYWKAAAVFRQLGAPPVRAIVDAGCGSGATVLAYLTTLEAALAKQPRAANRLAIHVTLLDRSQVQLGLAGDVFERVGHCLPHLDIHLRPRQLDLQSWRPRPGSADAVLFGHVLSENRASVSSLLSKAASAIGGSSTIYVIERKLDSIWDVLEACLPGLRLQAQENAITLDVGSIKLPKGHPAREKKWISARYLVLCRPDARSWQSS